MPPSSRDQKTDCGLSGSCPVKVGTEPDTECCVTVQVQVALFDSTNFHRAKVDPEKLDTASTTQMQALSSSHTQDRSPRPRAMKEAAPEPVQLAVALPSILQPAEVISAARSIRNSATLHGVPRCSITSLTGSIAAKLLIVVASPPAINPECELSTCFQRRHATLKP